MAKLAVVSGDGTGIGARVAGALAEDGYDVIVVGRRPGPLAEVAATHPAITAVTADVADPDRVGAVVAAVDGRPVDAVVNAAGGFVGRTGDGLSDVADQWRAAFDSNVLTALVP